MCHRLVKLMRTFEYISANGSIYLIRQICLLVSFFFFFRLYLTYFVRRTFPRFSVARLLCATWFDINWLNACDMRDHHLYTGTSSLTQPDSYELLSWYLISEITTTRLGRALQLKHCKPICPIQWSNSVDVCLLTVLWNTNLLGCWHIFPPFFRWKMFREKRQMTRVTHSIYINQYGNLLVFLFICFRKKQQRHWMLVIL